MLMKQVRKRESWTSWFRYAYTFPASDFKDCEVVVCSYRPHEDDVVIRFPLWPSRNKDSNSSYAKVERDSGFDCCTALARYDEDCDEQKAKFFRTLYFIQLLPQRAAFVSFLRRAKHAARDAFAGAGLVVPRGT